MSFNTDQNRIAEQRQTPPSVARWEWRTFSALPFPTIVGAELLDALTSQSIREGNALTSHERYFVTARSPHNVKVRANRLQVKRLVLVNRTGLQQWRPLLDAAFPIGGVRLRTFYTALGITRASVSARRYDQDDLLESALLCDPTLRIIDITKHRAPIRLQHGVGEHVTLTISGRQWYSLAFEHDDPVQLRVALQRLGLTSFPNTSYPAFLMRTAGSPRSTPSTFADVVPFPTNMEAL